jgi:uncharacterized protein YkwD
VMSRHRLRVLTMCGLGAVVLAIAQSGAAVAHRSAPYARVSQQCPNADTPVSSAPLTTLRAAVLCLTNRERNAHGLPGLRASARLNRVAQRLTWSMVTTRAFGHGPDFTLRLSASGYDWRAAGENIASGYTTPRSVVNAWMASPDHCRNILNPAFRDLGAGAAAAGVASDTGPGTWAEDFGLLMSQSVPSRNTGPQSACPY